MHIYCIPGTDLKWLYMYYLIKYKNPVTFLILQMKKFRPIRIAYLCHGYTISKWQSQNSDLAGMTPESLSYRPWVVPHMKLADTYSLEALIVDPFPPCQQAKRSTVLSRSPDGTRK